MRPVMLNATSLLLSCEISKGKGSCLFGLQNVTEDTEEKGQEADILHHPLFQLQYEAHLWKVGYVFTHSHHSGKNVIQGQFLTGAKLIWNLNSVFFFQDWSPKQS